jgi:hypothetical protein
MMMMVMIAHASVSAKSSLQLTRIGQAMIVSATPLYRPRRRLGQAAVSAKQPYRPRCRIGQAVVPFVVCPLQTLQST